jgi:hypothetical protein
MVEAEGGEVDSNILSAPAGYLWYFAIGSMIGLRNINQREIFPKESKPAEIQDFEIVFFGSQGMAVAVKKSGATFHGVLHLCTEEEMSKLD